MTAALKINKTIFFPILYYNSNRGISAEQFLGINILLSLGYAFPVGFPLTAVLGSTG